MKITHFKLTDVSKSYPPFTRRSCLIPNSTLLFENLGKSKNYQVILFLLSSNAKKEFYRIKQFSRENNNKVFSITLKGYCCELDILSPINEYNSEPVNIGEVCVKGTVVNRILSPINEYNSEPVNIEEVCVKGTVVNRIY